MIDNRVYHPVLYSNNLKFVVPNAQGLPEECQNLLDKAESLNARMQQNLADMRANDDGSARSADVHKELAQENAAELEAVLDEALGGECKNEFTAEQKARLEEIKAGLEQARSIANEDPNRAMQILIRISAAFLGVLRGLWNGLSNNGIPSPAGI
jgi:hypothetical protein